MPKLTIGKPVEYSLENFHRNLAGKEKPQIIPQAVGLAKFACICLDIEAKQAGAWGPECKIVKFLKMPEGKLIKDTIPEAREGDYLYTPPRIGTDTVRFILENGAGRQVDVTIKLKASSYQGEASNEPDTLNAESAQPQYINALVSTSAWSNLLGDFSGNGVTLSFADLPDAAVGQTTGTTITLDTTAAGHGWYIDSTPTDNTEYLPTSNPNEWIAKSGSEAYGKMDMLSVLLHEYGHALGLEHSTDAHDFMATTLQPGVRRTLTVDEQLALMQLAGYFPTPDSPSAPYGPTDPGAPLPFTRVLSNARNARLRREESLDALVPQFDTVANAKLTNPEFAGPSTGSGQANGWATTGDVAFANGTATLTEREIAERHASHESATWPA